MRQTMTKMALAGLCCCALACGQNKQVGTQYAASALISAQAGGSLSVTSAEDPKLAGTKVQIPPTALAHDTTITIAEGNGISAAQLATNESVASAVVAELGPSGTSFSLPVTITLPYSLPSGSTISQLGVAAVEDDGTTTIVGNTDLQIDASSNLASFTAVSFTRFAVILLARPGPCPAGEALCGCNGGGQCLPAGQPCPALCPISTGGSSGGGSGGSCCPAGEYFCGCNGSGSCVADTVMCELNCSLQGGSGGSASPAPGTPSPAVCCPPGDYYCGCPGSTNGSCVTDDQPCDWSTLACPAPTGGSSGGGSSGGSGGGCCPAGDYYCGCPGMTGSCVPVGQSCVVACPAEQSSGGGTTTPPSTDCCPTGTTFCGCNGQGNCIPDGQPCSAACPPPSGGSSGGSGGGGCLCGCPSTGPCDCSCDGGTPCPADEVDTACGCLPPNVICAPPGCLPGETECCGVCQPADEACPGLCPPTDGGVSGPPCAACACAINDPSCVCGCYGDAGVGSDGGIIGSGDAGCVVCPAGESWCGCSTGSGSCIPSGQTCPLMCATRLPPTCEICPSGETLCPNGQCIPQGAMCTTGGLDGGNCDPTTATCCPQGYVLCNGQCIVDTLPCGVSADAG
ncbi:MAG: hypothetical protein ACYDCL_22645 [Myxococcales bacterium]